MEIEVREGELAQPHLRKSIKRGGRSSKRPLLEEDQKNWPNQALKDPTRPYTPHTSAALSTPRLQKVCWQKV